MVVVILDQKVIIKQGCIKVYYFLCPLHSAYLYELNTIF